MSSQDEYALRKAQLIAQCDLERLRIQFALHELRVTVNAPIATEPTVWAAPVAATLISFALPALGVQRVTGIVQILSFALKGYQALQNWRHLQLQKPLG
jgi:hypothetical protein